MKEIGRRLRAAREAKSISLETAEGETRIRRKYLEALEQGREADIPGDVYVKGFLRTYGNFLDLDGTALVEEYKQTREVQADADLPQPQASPASERPAVQVITAAAQRHDERDLAPDGGAGIKVEVPWRGIITTAVILAILGLLVYLGMMILRQVNTKPSPKPPATVATAPPAATPPPKLPEQPKVTMTPGTGQDVIFAVPAKEVQVHLDFGAERPWLEATVDGAKTYSGKATTSSMDLKGNKLNVRMGYMEDISLSVNGQQFDKPLKGGPYTLIFNGQ